MNTHVRNFGGAVLGFIVMSIVVLILTFVLALTIGDGAGGLIAGSIIVSLLAAILGGIVCSKVAADTRGVWILMVAVVVFGIVLAVMPDLPVDELMEAAEVDMTDDMDSIEEPAWLTWVTPLLGAIGVYIGARLVKGD